MASKLEKSIFSTIAYFDIFSYPLTLVEIWKWLYFESPYENKATQEDVSLSKIREVLENSPKIKSLIKEKWGFYFLKNREEIVGLRRARYNFAEEKIRKALKIIYFFKFIPGIEMIGLCNSLSWANAREESDIDLLIITKKNRIWISRFFSVLFLKIFGLRPKKNKLKDKICLSFFIDEDNLNLEKFSVDDPDIYLIYWINQMTPLFNTGSTHKKFLENNLWINKYLPNIISCEGSERRRVKSFYKSKESKRSFLENFLKRVQYRVFPKEMMECANRGKEVIINDGVLKFHCNDKREDYKKEWLKRINEFDKL